MGAVEIKDNEPDSVRSAVTRRAAFRLVGSMPVLVLASCNSAPRTIRYRMTVEVETPEGLRMGSSVMETRASYTDGFLKGLGNAVRITWEEAVRRFGGARQSNVTRRRFG